MNVFTGKDEGAMTAGRAKLRLVWRGPLVLAALLFVTGCCTTPEDEEWTGYPEETQAAPADGAFRGRQMLESARRGGAEVLTLYFHSGTRRVSKEIELFQDSFCATVIAARGAERRNDDWVNYDTTTAPDPRWCLSYDDIRYVEVGDARWR